MAIPTTTIGTVDLGNLLLSRAAASPPSQTPGAGINRLAQSITGSILNRREEEADARTQQELAGMLAGQPVNPLIQSMLASSNPRLRRQASQLAIAQALQGPGERNTKVVPGVGLVDVPLTGPAEVLVAEAPRPAKPSETERLFTMAGLDPDSQEAREMALNILRRRGEKPSVNVGATTVRLAPQEQEESKAEGKRLVSAATKVFEEGDAALSQLQTIQIAKSIPVPKGSLEPLKAKASALLEGLGVDPGIVGLDSATNAQAFTGIMQNAVLNKLQAQKGPQTENDAKRIEQTVATLGNTEDAANFLMDAAAALRRRDIEKAEFWTDWRSERGTYNGARKAWNDRIKKTPLVGTNPNSGLPVFYYDFQEKVMQANPGASMDDVKELWSRKYGGSS